MIRTNENVGMFPLAQLLQTRVIKLELQSYVQGEILLLSYHKKLACLLLMLLFSLSCVLRTIKCWNHCACFQMEKLLTSQSVLWLYSLDQLWMSNPSPLSDPCNGLNPQRTSCFKPYPKKLEWFALLLLSQTGVSFLFLVFFLYEGDRTNAFWLSSEFLLGRSHITCLINTGSCFPQPSLWLYEIKLWHNPTIILCLLTVGIFPSFKEFSRQQST